MCSSVLNLVFFILDWKALCFNDITLFSLGHFNEDFAINMPHFNKFFT
jgi:hypothetical protein